MEGSIEEKLSGTDPEDYFLVSNIDTRLGVINDETEEPQQPIIFSENSYQSYQQTSLNWSNIRMADIMTRFHTFCIGFSGDDTNFRMLRHFLSQREDNPVMGEKKELYLMRVFERDIKNLADPSNTIDSANANKHQECAYRCVKTYFHIINAYFEKQLNTHIIWSGSFSEMAQQNSELSET